MIHQGSIIVSGRRFLKQLLASLHQEPFLPILLVSTQIFLGCLLCSLGSFLLHACIVRVFDIHIGFTKESVEIHVEEVTAGNGKAGTGEVLHNWVELDFRELRLKPSLVGFDGVETFPVQGNDTQALRRWSDMNEHHSAFLGTDFLTHRLPQLARILHPVNIEYVKTRRMRFRGNPFMIIKRRHESEDRKQLLFQLALLVVVLFSSYLLAGRDNGFGVDHFVELLTRADLTSLSRYAIKYIKPHNQPPSLASANNWRTFSMMAFMVTSLSSRYN